MLKQDGRHIMYGQKSVPFINSNAVRWGDCASRVTQNMKFSENFARGSRALNCAESCIRTYRSI
jgi:hypothetical protein